MPPIGGAAASGYWVGLWRGGRLGSRGALLSARFRPRVVPAGCTVGLAGWMLCAWSVEHSRIYFPTGGRGLGGCSECDL